MCGTVYSLHTGELIYESHKITPNFDCKYTFLIDVEPNGILFDADICIVFFLLNDMQTPPFPLESDLIWFLVQ